MHFHDCHVRGCDGSVLLASTSGNPVAERDNPANNPSLRGFEVIGEAKTEVEAACPETVSCADIIAFAARDSARKVGGINYDVPAGRRDGRVSLSEVVLQNLPAPFFNAQELVRNFARKGLSADEMVTLSGAHSMGVSHCSSSNKHLCSFNATYAQDASMDPTFSALLKTKCPPTNSRARTDPTVVLDFSSPYRLGNEYYEGLGYRHDLLTSDQTLLSSQSTSQMVISNPQDGSSWAVKFANAMVQMGSVDVLTDSEGEIRRHCSFVN